MKQQEKKNYWYN